MRTIHIPIDSLPLNPKYLCDKQGTLDLLGHILVSLTSRPIEWGTRTPCCLPYSVSPLTTLFRETVILTPLGYQLLQLTKLPTHQQLPQANQLLLPRNIRVIQDPEELLAQAYKSLNR